jgi:hypothetical protein
LTKKYLTYTEACHRYINFFVLFETSARSCDFEDINQHFCGWYNTPGYPTVWLSLEGDYWLGPGHDHTTGESMSLYLGFPRLYTGPTDEVVSLKCNQGEIKISKFSIRAMSPIKRALHKTL